MTLVTLPGLAMPGCILISPCGIENPSRRGGQLQYRAEEADRPESGWNGRSRCFGLSQALPSL